MQADAVQFAPRPLYRPVVRVEVLTQAHYEQKRAWPSFRHRARHSCSPGELGIARARMTGYTEVIGRSSALADDFRKGPSLVSTSLWQRAQVCTAHVSHLASRGLVFKTYHTGSQRTREAFMLARLHT